MKGQRYEVRQVYEVYIQEDDGTHRKLTAIVPYRAAVIIARDMYFRKHKADWENVEKEIKTGHRLTQYIMHLWKAEGVR